MIEEVPDETGPFEEDPDDIGRHDLEKSVPGFLLWLDRDPVRAWKEFDAFTWKLLRAMPPPIFRSFSTEDQEDMTAEIILKCQKDRFRRLRKYRNKGLPFAVWLLVVARRHAHDKKRRQDVAERNRTVFERSEWPGIENEVDWRKLLGVVRLCLGEMGRNCQLLIQAAADEYSRDEMAAILGGGQKNGKQASDSLRHCRKVLIERLKKRGFDPELI